MIHESGKVYIFGPISGHILGNKPLFDKAAENIRKHYTYEVINPFDIADQDENDAALLDPYGDVYWKIIAKCLKTVRECDILAALPGWKKSKGARLEAMVGLLHDKTFKYYRSDGVLLELRNWEVADALRESFGT